MTNDELKAIYEYMKDAGWEYDAGLPYPGEDGTWKYCLGVNILDSNAARECVREMERKGDWQVFEGFAYDREFHGNKADFIPWLYNPTNFFNCFGKWCLERRGK